jgi:diguanylate cyclase (GGDEF)-like protein
MSVSHIMGLQAADVADMALALKWNAATMILVFALLPWYIALFTGKRPLPFLLGLSAVYGLLFVLNLEYPDSLLYDSISNLKTIHMPWGETLVRAEGNISRWAYIAAAAVFVGFAYIFHALFNLYRRDRSRANIGMLLAAGLLLANSIQGTEARLLCSDSIAFGPIGFFAFIIVMSRILHNKYDKQKRQAEEKIWHQANYDPLTGLPNRRMFHDRLDQEIKKAQRGGQSLALVYLDLDLFKEVNDTLGHDVGDILLREAALRIASCVRETVTVSRVGGDEFTIIFSVAEEPRNLDRVTGDILRKLAEPFHLGNEVIYITVSIGITLFPEDATTLDALLKNADQAMYAAKKKGRNQHHYFTKSMQQAAQNRLRVVNDLREALAAHQFRVYYQPIVDLQNGAVYKAEALVRWEHPKRGLVGPLEFIGIAEETGLINDIGEWVFQQAAQQVKKWRKSHHSEFQISVNKSPVQFHNSAKNQVSWTIHLDKLGLPGQSIVVEITEGLLLDTGTAVTELLQEFRDAGIQMSLDDFGTGYSSLSYLNKFDLDYLKIDQSFVRDLAAGSSNMALCEAIIVMAHKLGLKVIAEGIETAQHRELLTKAGCDYGQGFLFSRPIPADQFEALFIKRMGQSQSHLRFDI